MINKNILNLLVLGSLGLNGLAASGGPYDNVQYQQVPARPSAVIDPNINIQDQVFLQRDQMERDLTRIRKETEREQRKLEQQRIQLEQARVAAQQAQYAAQQAQYNNRPNYNNVPSYNQPPVMQPTNIRIPAPGPDYYATNHRAHNPQPTVTSGSFGKTTVMRRIGVDGEGRPIFYFSPLPTYPLREVSSGVSNQVYGDGIRIRTTVISDARGTIYELTESVGGY